MLQNGAGIRSGRSRIRRRDGCKSRPIETQPQHSHVSSCCGELRGAAQPHHPTQARQRSQRGFCLAVGRQRDRRGPDGVAVLVPKRDGHCRSSGTRIDDSHRGDEARLVPRERVRHGAGGGERHHRFLIGTARDALPEDAVTVDSGGKRERGVSLQQTAIASLLLAAMALGVVLVLIGGRRAARHNADRAVNPVAQDLYLKGKYYWNQRTPESLNRAVGFFNQAIASDPGYAEAYAGLADCYNLLREYSAMPASEAWPRAIAAAKKAVELDNSSADAHTSLAFALFYGALDTAAGEREYRRAIELNPGSANAHHWYATSLVVQGRYRESLAEIERARELDPSSTSILADKGLILFDHGHVEQSIALLKQVEAADPASQSAHTYLARIDLTRSEFSDYLTEAQKAAELSRNAAALAIAAAARKGFAAGGSRAMLASILEIQKDLLKEGRCSHYEVARTYALMGKRQEALDQLQAAMASREMDIVALNNDPTLASLRGEPRFQDLQKELRRVLPS